MPDADHLPDAPSYEALPHQALADLPGIAHDAMRRIILAQAESAGLTVLEDAGPRLTVRTAHGLIGLRPGREAETAGMVAAQDARWLFVMKTAVVDTMRRLMPETAEAMRWSDGDAPGALPPNFQFARAVAVEPLGPVFLRVTLEGEDFSSYGDDSIHFRLVQPPRDAEPEWPGLAPNGSVRWPEGPGAPHKPVYTARSVDAAAGRLVTDVYVHEGGRTTAWAQELMAGERGRRVVGLTGPSGGGLMDAERVLMATDETGFPAAARILENLPQGASGTLLLEAEDGAACGYPIEAPPGVETRWLARARGEALGEATLQALEGAQGAKLWFAGEKGDAKLIRDAAKAAGWEPGGLRVSGFWSAPA